MASIINATTTNGVAISADNSGILQLATNSGTTAVTIDASQNVGIGTSSPAFKLDVVGGARISGNLGVGGSGTTTVSNGVAVNNSNGTYPGYEIQTGGTTQFYINATNGASYITSVGTNPMNLYTTGSASMNFATNNTERMRIDSSGNVLVGLTSALGPGYSNTNTGVQIASDGTTYISKTGNITTVINNNTSGNRLTVFNYQGTQKGSIDLITTTGVAYNSVSDYRLKENVVPMVNALDKIALLKPCTYKWKTDGSDGQGFIAHELQEVVPDCVTGEKDAVDEEGNPQYQGIDTSFLVATLTAALQEAHGLIKDLEARLVVLESKIV